MQGGVRLLGHPIHQMRVVFPLGLLAIEFSFNPSAARLTRTKWICWDL